MSINDDAHALFRTGGDPSLSNYYPEWFDHLADDATVEGTLLDGVVVGKDAVRSVVGTIRSLYDWQQFRFAGPCADKGWLEDYVAEVDGEPIGCVALVTRNSAGMTQHIVASYRPLTSVMHFAEKLAEKFAGTPIEQHFATARA